MIKSLQIGIRWTSNTAGGAERVFADLASSLPAAGVHFTGMVAGPRELAAQTNGLIHAFAPEEAHLLARLSGIRKELPALIAAERPDLLTSHFALYTAPVLDKLAERPFVMHFHGPWASEAGVEGASSLTIAAKSRLERAVYRRADRAIVLSDAFAQLLSKDYGVSHERIRVVPGAVDLQRFNVEVTRQQARETLGWPSDRPILFSVRRLVHRMGLLQLVEAMAQITRRVPGAMLFIGGTGPQRDALQTRAAELGISDSVRLLGFIPDEALNLAYRAADISVVPTVALEGFGLVAAESLAAGTPSMVTPVGGLPEVVKGLSENLIFASGSPEHLASGLSAALREELELPGETACRNYAELNFSKTLMADRTAAVYRELVK